MSFRLKPSRRPGKDLRSAVLAQLKKIERRLRVGSADDVHGVRKRLKRVRAALLLLRPVMGKQRWRHEDRFYRDIARALSGTRDAQAIRAGLSMLEQDQDRAWPKAAGRLLIETAEHGAGTAGGRRFEGAMLAQRVRAGRKALAKLSVRDLGWADVLERAEKCYRDGRKGLQHAIDTGDSESLHEWRKSVQRHWRQMQLLQRIEPEAIGARVRLAAELSDRLGEANDMALIEQRARACAAAGIEASGMSRLIALALERQRALRAEAIRLGQRLFDAKPRTFRHRLASYRKAAKAGRSVRRPARAGNPEVTAPGAASSRLH
jgi:CHAD domain-containing protein